MSLDHYTGPAKIALKADSVPAQQPGFLLMVAFLAHLPLALLMHYTPLAATIHGWAVFALGLFFLMHDQKLTRLLYLTGYIVGAEVVWRMTKASVFWEFGKYSVGFFLILALFKWHRRIQALPVLYGLLLIPSAVLTFAGYSLWVARSEVSFNLSGPFLLTIAALFFSGKDLHREQVQRLLLYIVMPICCIAFLAFFSIHRAEEIDFYQSNITASGGYGPNQVSAVLGLGALLCWLYILGQDKFSKMTWLVSGLLLWFLGQAFLTFSRGGVFNFFIAGSLATPFLGSKRRNLMTILMFGSILVAIFLYIFLKLDAFTGYSMQERFSETHTTGRWEMMQQDMRLWQNNFLFGVGPGRSPALRGQGTHFGGIVTGKRGGPAPHTEYSRLLAEHGLFGLLALLLMFAMFLRAFFKAPNAYARGLTLAFMVWALAEMSHAAMRLAVISYLYALPFARFEED